MTMKDKIPETGSLFVPPGRQSNFNSSIKKLAKIANINNYVLPLPMNYSFHGNTF